MGEMTTDEVNVGLFDLVTELRAENERMVSALESIGNCVLTPGNWEPYEPAALNGMVAAVQSMDAELTTLRERYRWRDADEELPEPGRWVESKDRSSGIRRCDFYPDYEQRDKCIKLNAGGFQDWRYCDDGPEESSDE